jgi:hypothetical protein
MRMLLAVAVLLCAAVGRNPFLEVSTGDRIRFGSRCVRILGHGAIMSVASFISVIESWPLTYLKNELLASMMSYDHMHRLIGLTFLLYRLQCCWSPDILPTRSCPI